MSYFEKINADFLQKHHWHRYDDNGVNKWTKGMHRMLTTKEALEFEREDQHFWSDQELTY